MKHTTSEDIARALLAKLAKQAKRPNTPKDWKRFCELKTIAKTLTRR